MAETPPADQSRPLVGEVIAIGDEMTTGQRLDTNTRWLAQRLTEQGVDVRLHTTVADDLAANVAVFRAAAERADVVVCTGGLGPTADDLTRDAMAAAANVELFEHPELVAALEERFASRGRTMPPQNRRQAQLPEGATAIPNPGGTAPGVDQRVGRCRLFALPGVPAEMKEMWAATVAPAVERLGGPRRVVRHWLVKCFGAGESHVESLVPDLIARGREPLVGITASKGTITLRVTASGADESACWEAMRPTLEEVRAKLGDLIFAEQPAATSEGVLAETDLWHAVLYELDDRDLTVACVESMTRGLLAHRLAMAEVELDADFRGGFRTGEPPRLVSARYVAAGIDTRSVVNEGVADCVIAVGVENESTVPVVVRTPRRTVEKLITLIGHPSIHRDLVAKHALNLLRLELLKGD